MLRTNKNINSNFKSLQVGQLLMVETTNEILVGELKYIDIERKCLELNNPHELNTNFKYTMPQLLPLPSIKTIKIVPNDNFESDESNSSESVEPTNVTTAKAADSLKEETFMSSCGVHSDSSSTEILRPIESYPSASLSSNDLQELQGQLNAVIYINQADHKYHKAMADLKKQIIISLIIDPVDYGRNQRTSLLAIATYQNVYIFDIILLGKFFRELKLLLESNRPRKAVHYSHRMNDQLHFRHEVQLAGIFDTFIAYCIVIDDKRPCSLRETLQRTFKLSDIYFKHDSFDNPAVTYNRPLTKAALQYFAKMAIFQLKLYDFLLHEQLLAKFYGQCDSFSKVFIENEDNVDVAMKMNHKSIEGFSHIKPISL